MIRLVVAEWEKARCEPVWHARGAATAIAASTLGCAERPCLPCCCDKQQTDRKKVAPHLTFPSSWASCVTTVAPTCSAEASTVGAISASWVAVRNAHSCILQQVSLPLFSASSALCCSSTARGPTRQPKRKTYQGVEAERLVGWGVHQHVLIVHQDHVADLLHAVQTHVLCGGRGGPTARRQRGCGQRCKRAGPAEGRLGARHTQGRQNGMRSL